MILTRIAQNGSLKGRSLTDAFRLGIPQGAPTARAKLAEIQALKAEGVGPSEIARRLGIGRSSVYRMLGSAA